MKKRLFSIFLALLMTNLLSLVPTTGFQAQAASAPSYSAGGANLFGDLETIVIPDEPDIQHYTREEVEPESLTAGLSAPLSAPEIDYGEFTQGPFVPDDERPFYVSVIDTVLSEPFKTVEKYEYVTGKLAAQGEHVNVWVLDDDVFHDVAGYPHTEQNLMGYPRCYLKDITPAVANDIANIIDGIYDRMTDEETGLAPHAQRIATAMNRQPYSGDIDVDGMMNFLLYDIPLVGGRFSPSDMNLPGENSRSSFLDVVQVRLSGLLGSNPLYYYGALAHEFQHFLFYTYFDSYSRAQGYAWINESLADYAMTYYLQPDAEVLIENRMYQAGPNPYSDAYYSFSDFLTFNSSKSYGMGSAMSLLFHKLTAGAYAHDIYGYIRTAYPPAGNSDEYENNQNEVRGRTVTDVWGDVAAAALGFNSSGEAAFAEMYWLFMKNFATDGGTVHGDLGDEQTTKFVVGNNYYAFADNHLWRNRDFSAYSLADGGTIELGGYGFNSPRSNATHEKFYSLIAPANPANTVLRFMVNDTGAGDSTKYYIALKREGALPNADLYPLTPGIAKVIHTNGKEAYLYVVTLKRQVDISNAVSYSWSVPDTGVIDGKVTLNSYAPIVNGTITAAVNAQGGPYSYVWTREGTVVGTNSSSYTTTEDDIGKAVKVTVTSSAYPVGSLTTQTVTVLKALNNLTPAEPKEQSKTFNSVTLVPIPGYEYAYKSEMNPASAAYLIWQDDPTFGNLLSDTTYHFYQREKATETKQASYSSPARQITTLPAAAYTITYNANGGGGEPPPQTKTQGVPMRLSSDIPWKRDCTFLGWASGDPNATVEDYAPGATFTTDDAATLYAVWGFTVTFENPYPYREMPVSPIPLQFIGPGTFQWKTGTDASILDLYCDPNDSEVAYITAKNPGVAVIVNSTVSGVANVRAFSVYEKENVKSYTFSGGDEGQVAGYGTLTIPITAKKWDGVTAADLNKISWTSLSSAAFVSQNTTTGIATVTANVSNGYAVIAGKFHDPWGLEHTMIYRVQIGSGVAAAASSNNVQETFQNPYPYMQFQISPTPLTFTGPGSYHWQIGTDASILDLYYDPNDREVAYITGYRPGVASVVNSTVSGAANIRSFAVYDPDNVKLYTFPSGDEGWINYASGQRTLTIPVTATKYDGTTANLNSITWRSLDESVATVNSATRLVTALVPQGYAVIVGTCDDPWGVEHTLIYRVRIG